ncbi:hypothetical protein ACS0TY_035885 [Phlomoides rotata]
MFFHWLILVVRARSLTQTAQSYYVSKSEDLYLKSGSQTWSDLRPHFPILVKGGSEVLKISDQVRKSDLVKPQTSFPYLGERRFRGLENIRPALERPLLRTDLPSVTQKKKVHQVEPRQVSQVIEPGKTDSAYTSPSPKEKGHLVEPSQGVPVIEPGHADYLKASCSSKLEETEHQATKLDASGQPTTSGVKEGEISPRPQKGPKRVDTNITGVKSFWFFNNTWESLLKGMEFRPKHFITDVSGKYPLLWALKGVSPNDVRRWYNFGALASIRTVAPSFQEISKLPDWVCNVVQESWHNNPHLKRGDELEIKFIIVASEDMTNFIQYPSFHFMKLQRPDHRATTYIKTQETKPALVVNLTKDEVSTR